MKKLTFPYLFLILLLTATSCNVLDQTSPNDVAQENLFKDAESLRSARIGMYSTLQNRYYYGGFYQLGLDCHSDDGSSGGFDITALDEFGARALTPSNIYVESMWIAIYNSINTANHILENVDKIQDPDLSQEERDDIKGEALFVRALGHFDLLRMFGEHWNLASAYGIPVVLKVQTPEDVPGRSTVAQTYTAIFNDLNDAETFVSDNNTSDGSFKGRGYITQKAVKALFARVYLYHGDKGQAASYAGQLINDAEFSLFDENTFTQIYTGRQSQESIFELVFDPQNRSSFNVLTYSRPDALRTEIFFLASEDLKNFFESRPGDRRAELLDYQNNDVSISPDGRTQKYRGEQLRDNPAYILRLAEMYLIRAEALGRLDGLADLNAIRTHRGLPALSEADVPDDASWMEAILNERRAEFNFEGQRYFDLARNGQVETVLGEAVQPVFPIPLREITATNGAISQYPGYQ